MQIGRSRLDRPLVGQASPCQPTAVRQDTTDPQGDTISAHRSPCKAKPRSLPWPALDLLSRAGRGAGRSKPERAGVHGRAWPEVVLPAAPALRATSPGTGEAEWL